MTAPTTRVPNLMPRPPVFRGAGLTHAGQVRERNEDSILTDPSGVLWAIADGMGGYGHGDMASDIVTDCLSTLPDDTLATPALLTRLHEANRLICARSREAGMGSMGATVVALMIQNSVANIAWAGDCRAYLLRQRQLRLLTRDHTVVQDMVDQGLLAAEQRESHPQAHVVTRAIGFEAEIDIDTTAVPLIAGDRLLMCSDGLTAVLGDTEIARAMATGESPEALCHRLVTAALEGGAPDNVSVIAIFAAEG